MLWAYLSTTSLACALGLLGGPGKEPAKNSSPIAIEGTRLTFDPKTCTRGSGGFPWGLGSVRVTVLGHEAGMCVFDYQWEIEQLGDYQVHRVRVPINSGPVVIEPDLHKGAEANHWSYLFTSFTSKQAQLVRQHRRGWDEIPVGEAGRVVGYRPFRPGDDSAPARPGDRITVRFLLFREGDFAALVGKEWQRRMVTVRLGEEPQWAWVEAVALGMTRYEVRQVRAPVPLTGPAKQWLPGYKDDSTLFAEIQLLAVEPR